MTLYAHDRQMTPCPFCGGEARLVAKSTSTGRYIGFVQCEKCLAQTRAFSVGELDEQTFDDAAFTAAAALWQQREGGD